MPIGGIVFKIVRIKRWLSKFEHRAKWNFCLTAAKPPMIRAIEHSEAYQASER